jgi:cytochrome d ubiquinol oxidase subunit II
MVSLWTPSISRIRERWFSTAEHPVPVADPGDHRAHRIHGLALGRTGREVPPFLAAIVLFMLGYAGLAISVFPYLVPYSITVWDAAPRPRARSSCCRHLAAAADHPDLYGFIYYLFRGKLKEGEGYH